MIEEVKKLINATDNALVARVVKISLSRKVEASNISKRRSLSKILVSSSMKKAKTQMVQVVS